MTSRDVGRLTVKDLMSEPVIVPPSFSTSKVVGILRDLGTYEVFIPVSDKVGMISMRDLLKVSNTTTQKTSSTMMYVPKLGPSTSVAEAADIMAKYRVRALPILENHKVIGQINAAAIIKILNPEHLKSFGINSIMTSNPIVIDSEDSAAKARSIMIRRKIDHLPVVKNKKLTGILRSNDIVFRMLPSDNVKMGALGAEKEIRLDFSVARVMDTHPLTCGVEDRISDVLKEVIRSQSTYTIALLWDEVQGIVTYRDFLKLVAAERGSIDIPMYMVGLPDDPFEAEATRDKFLRTVSGLRKTFTDILEARSIIKTKEIGSERRRYEVKVMLKTPYKIVSYSDGGYDLPSIYDEISNRMKRLMAQRPKRSRTSSIRRRTEELG